MVNEESILTVTELIDEYEKGNIKVSGKIYPVYMTELHKKDNCIGLVYDNLLPLFLDLRKKEDERLFNLFWGKL